MLRNRAARLVTSGLLASLLLVPAIPATAATCAGRPATLEGSAGDDLLIGTAGPDVIVGYGGDDVIRGLAGNDTICAGAGNDVLDGGPGDDRLFGGSGDDTLVGGPGDDLIQGEGGRDEASFVGSAGPVVASLVTAQAEGEGTDTLVQIEDLGGSDMADTLIGDGFRNELHGRAGDDTLWGRGGPDLVIGGNGFDRVDGGPGNDVLMGGPGADRLNGRNGDDVLNGGPGPDVVSFFTASNAVAIDLLAGVAEGDGSDAIVDVERVFGTKFADTIIGDGLPNRLSGGPGDDHLEGRLGPDVLLGGAGSDTIEGGLGLDTAEGGPGADTCRTSELLVSCLLGVNLELVLTLPGGNNAGLVTAPPGDDRLFVIDQTGDILVHDGTTPSVFLSLAAVNTSGGERGLLGLAFHPGYAGNGRFFVAYTHGPAGALRVAEYGVSADPTLAAPLETVIIDIAQPSANHNGGMIGFGPDGHLWIGLGDGGGGGDPGEHGQNPSTLLGSILRIDVDGARPYEIPAGNPFAGGGGAPEVFHFGVRNPWRFSFDGESLFVADVGQSAREEISVVSTEVGGANLGWDEYEGSLCFEGCTAVNTTFPVHEYGHSEGCSVIGGYVYRGIAMPELAGHYLYADLCSRWIRSFFFNGSEAIIHQQWGFAPDAVTSFGQGADGELYLSTTAGQVFRLTADR